jgi:hypothetical protein
MLVEDYNNNESLFSTLERDVFLSLVQYISPSTLRYFIGLSEESYLWGKHIHFVYYRLKRQIPLKQQLEHIPEAIDLVGNSIIFGEYSDIIFVHEVWNEIFELKLKYKGQSTKSFYVLTDQTRNTFSIFFKTSGKSGEYFTRNRLYGSLVIPPIFEDETIVRDGDVLTIVLNMLPREVYGEVSRTLSFGINDGMSRHILTNIPRRRQKIKIYGNNMTLTFISAKHLRNPSIQYDDNSILWDYDLSNHGKNCKLLKC